MGRPRRIGPFQVVDVIGRGGMGVVYLGRGRQGYAAVKVINNEYSQDRSFQARFRDEISLAGRISSRYVASLVAASPRGGELYLATEYVVGENLSAYVQRAGRLPRQVVVTLAAMLAQALTATHEAGVCHRDIKPSNIMLARDGLRLVDFGIGYAPDLGPAGRGQGLLGVPAFMSPEALRGARPSKAMDVYAWACTVVFAAAGRAPFGADWDRSADVPPRLTGVPAAIRPFVEQALDPDPSRRPSARALVRGLVALPELGSLVGRSATEDALTPLLDEHWRLPGLRQPEPRGGRWWSPGRRPWSPRVGRWPAVGAAAVAAMGVGALLVMSSWPRLTLAGGGAGTATTPPPSTPAPAGLAASGGPTTAWQSWSAYPIGGDLTARQAQQPASGLAAPPDGPRGACVAPAWTTARPDAVRCLDEHGEVHEPCWVPRLPTASIGSVLCGYPGQRTLDRIVLTTSLRLPDSPPSATADETRPPDTSPISIELAGGVLCLARSANPDDAPAGSAGYACAGGGEAVGLPDRSAPVWTIRYRAGPGTGISVVDIERCYF